MDGSLTTLLVPTYDITLVWCNRSVIDCSSDEAFNFDLSILFLKFSFLSARRHWITKYESGISTSFLNVFIRIRWYIRFFYLCKFFLLFLAKLTKLVPVCFSWSVLYILMLLYLFIPMFFALHLIQCICIIFDCRVIFIMCLKTFSSCCIYLYRLSIRIFEKIFTRLVWVCVQVIMFNKLPIAFCLLSSSFLRKEILLEKTYRHCIHY